MIGFFKSIIHLLAIIEVKFLNYFLGKILIIEFNKKSVYKELHIISLLKLK